ncbi:uncharacterized protein GIQ15_03395 [Arthroderma uncinatum]|uniref:uncharacterized protein n=1 Tax=Arthroderma uncinatum TaxID=74035 RepID=UPI00144AADE8|nr:uncharacterized protein GIQ15_03395 [Arthroderma uncinatum]KAF3484071.1 hypothetical protein GIQ15_03395 [Arthroderma uncinatum]
MEVYYQEYDPNCAPQVGVPGGSDKEAVKATVSTAAVYKPSRLSDSLSPSPRPFWKRKQFAIPAIVLTTVFIAVTIAVGLVVGLRNAKGATSPPPSSSSPSSSPDRPGYGGGPNKPKTVDDSWAYNGTAISSLTYSPVRDQDSVGTNYVVFYQHSNWEIRRSTWNNSQWHDSSFVTRDAHPGTPLSSYWEGEGDDIRLNLVYVDKNRVLQEIRGSHSGNDWINGTLGELSLVVDPQSAISVQYVGGCRDVNTAWLIYHAGKNNEARVLYWNARTDRWLAGETIEDVSATAGSSGQASDGTWRYYYVSKKTQQLNVVICPDCCSKPNTKWEQDINGPQVASKYGGIAVANVGAPRLLYYFDDKAIIRELNNTYKYPDEAWIEDVSSTLSDGNRGMKSDTNATVGPEGYRVISSVPNGRMSMAAGFRGKIQQLWLFYQSNGTDIKILTRDADAAGRWSPPASLKIGG